MNLKVFVKQALIDIAQGVADASDDKELEKLGVINPPLRPQWEKDVLPMELLPTNDGEYAQFIEFDIAVTSESAAGADGELGISVADVIKIGKLAAKTESLERYVNRIKFRVPVRLQAKTPNESEEN